MLDSYDVDLCTYNVKIELNAKTAWTIYELLLRASLYLPDAAAYFMEQWGGGDDVDFVQAMNAMEIAKMCECYAGAVRGILCKEISPKVMNRKETYRKREEELKEINKKEGGGLNDE